MRVPALPHLPTVLPRRLAAPRRAGAALLACAATAFTDLTAQAPAACAAAVAVQDSIGTGVPQATVVIGDATVRSDSAGRATVPLPTEQPVYARIRRIGFAPSRIMLFPACGLPPIATVVTMTPLAARLSTVTVSAARRPQYSGSMAAFYERRARGNGGVFLTHAEMMQRNAERLSDVLRTIPGIGGLGTRAAGMATARGARRPADRCFPLLVIDGMAQSTIGEISTEGIDPRGLAGVEVYSDANRTPTEFLSLGQGSRCGTIVLWSRRSDTYAPEVSVARNEQVPDSLIFDAGDVDQLAQLDTARTIAPLYPASLRRKALDGEVELELVVLGSGRPDLRRVRVVSHTHKDFASAVVDGLPLFSFEPARRNDRSVAQRMRMTFTFRAADQ